MRRASCGWSFRVGIWAFCMLSSVALADTLQGERAFQLSSQLSSATLVDFKQDMERAEDAFNREDVVKAVALLRRAAEQNYIPAQVRLGEILDYAEHDEEAVGWYMMAANQGDAAGEYNLGSMYAVGEGIEIDFKKAVYWTARSAKKDYLAAVKSLAQSYRMGGMGLSIDIEQAQFWEGKVNALEAAVKNMAKKTETETDKGKRK